MSEFIEQREHQLPADPRSASGVNDSGASELAQMQVTPSGEPPKAFDVRATYDSRPVQGFDYNINATGSFTYTANSEVDTTTDLTFIVPRGYVAVQRMLHHFMNPSPAFYFRNDVDVSFIVANSQVPYNQNIPVGIEADTLANTFFIADELQTVTARFTVYGNNTYTWADGQTFTIYASFYGNFLLKTNIPKEFEIANPTDKAWMMPKNLQAPAPISAPITQPVAKQVQMPIVQQRIAQPIIQQSVQVKTKPAQKLLHAAHRSK